MISSSTYDDGLLENATDQAGNTTTYLYDDDRRLFAVTDAAGQSVCTTYNALTDRVAMNYQEKHISVGYVYEKGNLVSINRSAFLNAGDTERIRQSYNFTYDAWGNCTGVSIGNTIPMIPMVISAVSAAHYQVLKRKAIHWNMEIPHGWTASQR